MNRSEPKTPKQICEEMLIDELRSNRERAILASENVIIERLLTRTADLVEVYEELYHVLKNDQRALRSFLRLVLSTSAFWSPERNLLARGERKKLDEINRQISEQASFLAALLMERSDLQNRSGFSSDTHYHIVDVIREAGEPNYLFESYLEEPLEQLSGQYDLKYWPTLSDCLDELARDAEDASASASDPLTAAATENLRSSLADYFKALYAAIEENLEKNCGFLPDQFKITDGAIATIGNCALDLDIEELVDGPYIRRLRQREREKLA